MAGGGGGGRELDETPTWAVSMVCAVIVAISFALEGLFHLVAKIFHKKHKYAMLEALEKIKGELMILGFISLLLTFGQQYISQICIPYALADTMLPCPKNSRLKKEKHNLIDRRGRLLWYEQRMLAGGKEEIGCHKGEVPLITAHGLHQLHIFIFFLAVFHVFYSAITMTLGRLKIRKWKQWERETETEPHMVNDSSRFRLTHEVSFVRGHTNSWMQSPSTFYFLCFFRQFFRSVRRPDYLTMRNGFINVHLAPGSKFDFQKYIKRSLEDDFKVVVGISPPLWACMLVSLLLNVNGWSILTYFMSSFPLMVILAVGTKLQGIISQMAMEIKERNVVVQGIPLVQVSDSYFWFNRPQLILHLIHFVLFQNAFEITYFLWTWYEFGLGSCYHEDFTLALGRFFLGIAVQFMCSYITLPLYALVTQMGSTMKKAIFDDQTSKALKQWHKKAKKHESIRSQSSISRSLSQSIRTLGRPINSIRLQSLSSQRVAPSAAAATAAAAAASTTAAAASEVEKTPPNKTTANRASVDLSNDRGSPYKQPPDLLS